MVAKNNNGDWYMSKPDPFGVKENTVTRNQKKKIDGKQRTIPMLVWPPEGDEEITDYGHRSIEELEG